MFLSQVTWAIGSGERRKIYIDKGISAMMIPLMTFGNRLRVQKNSSYSVFSFTYSLNYPYAIGLNELGVIKRYQGTQHCSR